MRTWWAATLVGFILAFLFTLTAWGGQWMVIDSSTGVLGYGNGVYYIPGPIPGWCTFSGSGDPASTTTWVWKNANWYEGVPANDSATFYRDFFIPAGATIISARLRFRVDNFGWVEVNGTRLITYDWNTGCTDTCGSNSRDGCWTCDAPGGDLQNTTALLASLRVGQWNRLAWGVQNAPGCAPSSAGGIVRLEIYYNRPPTAQNDSYTTYKNTPLTVPAPGVLANDSDPDGDS
ncbi:MAG: Ig-like domain-containing protein, partial [Anaerolineae bacterium]